MFGLYGEGEVVEIEHMCGFTWSEQPEHLFFHWCDRLLFTLLFDSMDGFRVVKLNEVIRQVDVVITCTGKAVWEW